MKKTCSTCLWLTIEETSVCACGQLPANDRECEYWDGEEDDPED